MKIFKALTCSAALLASTNTFAGLIDYNFNYTGAVQSWTVTQTGTYSVYAQGAQGGDGRISTDSYVGGRGAGIYGEFNLTIGDLFLIAVGGMGSSDLGSYNGGGGGGTFFVSNLGTPLLIAGGGGGIRAYSSANGCDASVSQYGTTASGGNPAGGCAQKTTNLGFGGIISTGSYGSGGGGFYGAGVSDYGTGGGKAWIGSLVAAATQSHNSICFGTGGFGGGGIGGCGGGSGGGGYSGGDGGYIAGGGGSFNTGVNQRATAGVGYNNGLMTISLLSRPTVPQPGTVALIGLGLACLSLSRKKKVN